MTINPEWEIAFREYQNFSDKATDYLIASWKLRNEDKEICLLYRKKYIRLAHEWLLKMIEIQDAGKLTL